MTAVQTGRRFGATRGEFALLMTVTVVLGLVVPAGGLLAAFGSLLTGVRDDRRRVRALFIVGLGMLVLQVAFVAVALWGPVQVCNSTNGGPETCQTYWPWEG
ncbi:hypothetical protein NYS50_15835 [Curtobacterium flaccumfaciens pv. flaccumfaciens]|uniref:hypothetical protein n=1 Tax=Curtobacterium flaccumfaciens TaxID=2035 RepID=UPI00217D3F5E|nr:hypothetical protein [Curtobacterium flaccumfaciens]MCS6549352.1 hypothetical protein [Curtobacterium flaccumfaciens pv. flaccumfaciens]